MTETAFNLVDEPWIRVLQPDGTAAEVSLRDVLLRAHTFADLGGELPTQNIAVLRLLLAVLHTANLAPSILSISNRRAGAA